MASDGLKKFLDHARALEPSANPLGQNGFAREFQEIKQISSKIKKDPRNYSTNHGELECNRSKNRYKDILPFDQTRIILPPLPGVDGSDYINGNYIKGPDGSVSYLATQGPLPKTVNDFWRMIWHHNVQVIVMVCREYEMGKMKCKKYWPGSVDACIEFAEIRVKMVSEHAVGEGFTMRALLAEVGQEKRHIAQFHYTSWPDHDVPQSAVPLLELNRTLRTYTKEGGQPVVVHCSAGCGRTGTICAVDFAWSLIKMQKTEDFSVFKIVADMRRQRPAMVQTKEQYAFIYKAVIELVKEELQKEESRRFQDHTYVNVEIQPDAAEDYANCDFIDSVKRWTENGEKPVSLAGKVKVEEKKPSDRKRPAIATKPCPTAPKPASSGGKLTRSTSSEHAYVNVDFSAPESKAAQGSAAQQSGDYVNVPAGEKPKPPSREALPGLSKPQNGGPGPQRADQQGRPQGVKMRAPDPPVSAFPAPHPQAKPKEVKSSGLSHPQGLSERPSGAQNSDYVIPPKVPPQGSPTRASGGQDSEYVIPAQAGLSQSIKNGAGGTGSVKTSGSPSVPVVPEGLLIDFSEPSQTPPIKRHSSGYVNVPASDGHRRKFSSPAILNAQRNILTNANLSKPEEYVIPANVLPSKNDAAAKPGRAACKQPINNVADSGGAGSDGYSLVSVPGRSPAPRDDGYSFVSMPQRDPPKRDDGYSFVAMPQRETTPPRDDGYSLVAVPGRSPAPRDDGYSFVAMPHRGPAKQSQSPPGSVVSPVPAEKPAVLSKTPASKPSVTAEGQYSLVGPLGGNDRVDVVPRKSQDPPGAYCLVGIPMNEGAAASANLGRSDAVSSNPGPYDLVGAPGLQGRQPDVPAQQDPTYSTVQPSNNVAFTGESLAPRPPSIRTMPQKSKSAGDMTRGLERDKQKIGDVTLQQGGTADLYAAVIPRAGRATQRNGRLGSDSGSTSSQSPHDRGSNRFSSSSATGWTSASSEDQEATSPPVPVKTTSAFALPGEHDDWYDNVERTAQARGGTFGRLRKIISLKKTTDQISEGFSPVNDWLRELEYEKRIQKPSGGRTVPQHWPPIPCFNRV